MIRKKERAFGKVGPLWSNAFLASRVKHPTPILSLFMKHKPCNANPSSSSVYFNPNPLLIPTASIIFLCSSARLRYRGSDSTLKHVWVAAPSVSGDEAERRSQNDPSQFYKQNEEERGTHWVSA